MVETLQENLTLYKAVPCPACRPPPFKIIPFHGKYILLLLVSIVYAIFGQGNILLPGLIRLPQLYMNFVEEQYMSVFAIALPYTNPFK